MRKVAVSVLLVACVLAPAGALAAGEMPDVYEILANHYEALGGLDKLRAEETIHFVAELSLAGLSGSVELWQASPDRNRTEVDLTVFKQTTGDNGTVAWALDANGKLRIEQDENALAQREVARRLALFEHLDPTSEVFSVSVEGIRNVDGRDCYVVSVGNTLSDGEMKWYIDTIEFLMRKSINKQSGMEQHILHSDHRDVNGVIHEFHQDIEMLPIGQQQTLVMTVFETNVDIDPELFEPPADEADDYTFTAGGTHADVPFEFIERHLFLPVTIASEERLWVLDSGASSSVLDREYAETLGLELSGEIKGQGAGNTVDVSFTTLPAFAIEGIAFEEQQVAVIELADLFRRTSDLEIAGILGYDFLSRFTTRVDYTNELLTFHVPEAFEYEGEGAVLDAPLSGNLFTVEATVDGIHGGRWMLDLGAGGVTFHAPYAKEHDLGARKGYYGVGFGAGGRIMQYASQYETMEFGGHTIERPRIASVGYNEDTGAFASTETTGNLGNYLFRHFVLYLDYENQQVIVEKGEDFGADFPIGKSGLQLWRPESACEVLYVSPGTPAAEAGFVEGDVVVRIDGTDVADYGGLLDLRRLFEEESGTSYLMDVERGGETLSLELVLRDLF